MNASEPALVRNPGARADRKFVPLAVILLVWAFLYLPHLRSSPPWYGDETIALDIAMNLTRGELAFAAQWNTFLTVVYQPIYEGWVALWLLLAGPDIGPARIANAILALGIALVIYLLGRQTLEASGQDFTGPPVQVPAGWATGTALGASLIFLSAISSVLHFRMVMPHNGVAFGVTLAMMAACLKAGRSSDTLMGLGNLVAVGSHPLGVFGALSASIARLGRPGSWFRVAILPACFFLLLYSWPFAKFGSWVIADAMAIFESYGDYAEANQSNLLSNLYHFFSYDAFHILGFLGAVFLPLWPVTRRLWPVSVVFVVLCLALFTNRSNLPVFYYQAVVLLPSMAFGIAGLLIFLGSMVAHRLPFAPGGLPVCCGLLAVLSVLPTVWSGSLKNRNDYWATQNVREVAEVAAWINERLGPDDLVVTNSNLGWLLKCRYANLLQLTAWHGHRTFMHEKGTPRERFRHNLDTDQISYLVLGDIDQRWGVAQPLVANTLREQGILEWPVIWRGPHYLILSNPARKHDTP
ncbi:MAG: hypothetical protein Fur0032_14620 [Terrimicrobiaceae bacterium]